MHRRCAQLRELCMYLASYLDVCVDMHMCVWAHVCMSVHVCVCMCQGMSEGQTLTDTAMQRTGAGYARL